MSRYNLIIKVPIYSAAGDDKLLPKVVELLKSDDVVFFGVTRAVSKAKKPKDAIEVNSMSVEYEEVN